jgi:hypothetical protein
LSVAEAIVYLVRRTLVGGYTRKHVASFILRAPYQSGCAQGIKAGGLALVPRTHLPRTSVNKGMKKGRDPYSRTLASLPHPLARGKRALPNAIEGCYFFGLITPQVAGMVASWGSEGSSSLLPAALKS